MYKRKLEDQAKSKLTIKERRGGRPGLVVMGGDLCYKGREFESQHYILDGHFAHLFVVRIIMLV